ncbi:Sad1/UNC-like protein, partial [Tilletiaria anomala UBC 951]
MLSPCPGASDGDPQGQFVVVELCDEIKIDTLVLANFEFFSRMFKRFRVRVSKNLLDDPEDWFDLGTYRARNLRGLQVFNVPPLTGDRQFFRYMRIDILEHYGSEYYCPLSLLRVYGLTQLDDFKKEEEESQRLLEAMANDD